MKFLADEMCGAVCRWLRLLGYYTKFAKDYEDTYGTPVLDSDLLNECFKDHLILVSKDQEMVMRMKARYKQVFKDDAELRNKFDLKGADKKLTPAILLNDSDVLVNLRSIYEMFHIRTEYNADLARCSNCNAKLQKIEDPESYESEIPERVFEYHSEFWRCTNAACGKLYWKGTHFTEIEEKLEMITDDSSN